MNRPGCSEARATPEHPTPRAGFCSASSPAGVSFVQNHPYDSSKVIVYTAPEGDEVAVYTRGTARLTDGQATVLLGETFPLVSNPEVGITAYVTPLDERSHSAASSHLVGIAAASSSGEGHVVVAVSGLTSTSDEKRSRRARCPAADVCRV